MQTDPDLHILVVEDDTDTREALCESLIDAGYLPLAVSDGVEALEHLRSGHRPALIVLDLMLPRIDGWRFLSIIAESPELSTIPVVVCSGAVDRVHPPGVPPDHVLEKPVEMEKLLAYVVRYCGAGTSFATPVVKRPRRRAAERRRKREGPAGP
jgi:CheY-like chemotaxis protein